MRLKFGIHLGPAITIAGLFVALFPPLQSSHSHHRPLKVWAVNTRINFWFIAALAFLVLGGSHGVAEQAASITRELIVCGRDEVFIVNLDRRDAAGTPQKIWSWQAARCSVP